jgi:lipopolysaccharide transport system permease protein
MADADGTLMRSIAPRAERAPLAGLVWTLVRTDFKARYRPTVGGFVWALLKPMAMFIVLLAVFSFIFASDPRYKINLIIGLFLWDFFAEATKVGLLSLYAKRFLLTKAMFPSWILVVTSIANAAITLSVFVVVVLIFLVAGGRVPSAAAAGWFVAYLIQYALIVVGFSLAASVLFLRYRDLNQVWDVVAQAGFFLAPIVYPLDIIPERFHMYFYFWPPTAIIQFSRSVLVNAVIPTPKAHALLALETVSVLVVGIAIFRAHAPRAAEYV